MGRRHLAAAVAAACALGLVAVAFAEAAPRPPRAPSSVPSAPTPERAWIGRLVAPTTARSAPRLSAKVRTVLQPIAPLGNGEAAVLVTRSTVEDGRRWVEVLLPIRPNGIRGWVPAAGLQLTTTSFRIVIDVGDRRLTLFRRNRPVLRARVAVGKPGTETPRSTDFAIAEAIPLRIPGAFLGPIVLPITGYSETLNEFAGGNGRVAIHGTSLPGLIGTAASNGCIRMYNRDVVRLARAARPGTPLTIRS